MKTKDYEKVWHSLGVAFHGYKKIYNVDPEISIIELIDKCDLVNDREKFSTLLGWLQLHGKYIHIERLKALAKSSAPYINAVLGALSLKLKSSDHRWSALYKNSVNLLDGKRTRFKIQEKESFLKFKGEDKEFKKFGIRIALMRKEKEGKFYNIKKISQNLWIKNRIIFGVNTRADSVTTKELGLFNTAYAASKYLHLTPGSVKKVWNDLELVSYITT